MEVRKNLPRLASNCLLTAVCARDFMDSSLVIWILRTANRCLLILYKRFQWGALCYWVSEIPGWNYLTSVFFFFFFPPHNNSLGNGKHRPHLHDIRFKPHQLTKTGWYTNSMEHSPWETDSCLCYRFYILAGSGRSLNSSQVRVTAITEATGRCTVEANPLPKINSTTSTLRKLFIYSKQNIATFFRRQGVIWPLQIIRFSTTQNEWLMNLERHEECRPITSDSD
jgi:hypothetical protein